MTEVDELLDSVAQGIERALAAQVRRDPLMVGIRTGGVWVAERLHARLALTEPLGMLNINFYRDDFTRIGLHPRVSPSSLPFQIDARHIVLVDDVIHTGRTIRAALNEVFDYGRPASVLLCTLVVRSGRELPIQPDVAGEKWTLKSNEYVKLSGPEPLRLEVKRSG